LVVLTFDDSKASHYTVVRPILKRYGFGATFFITEGFTFRTNKEEYLTWEQIAELHRVCLELPILWLNPGLRHCVAPDVCPTLSRA
jgi:peptidoglycan/xylan/chitin deacetylase (PgdA/CDA1 family)